MDRLPLALNVARERAAPLAPILAAVAVVKGNGPRPGLLGQRVGGVVPAENRAFNHHQRTSQTSMGIRPHSSSSVSNAARANGRWRLTTLPATRHIVVAAAPRQQRAGQQGAEVAGPLRP